MGDVETDDGIADATLADTPGGHARQRARATGARRLGHFQLLDAVGEGGMGTVFSAYDLRLDRRVALKLLPKQDTPERDQQGRQRMLREAQAMAKLNHPNVVPVYEVGEDDDTVYIAMEYIGGRTLDRWLTTRRTWREIVAIFIQAGRGLAAAHAAGVVHRDFKPTNVVIAANGHVRVVDFGIAQMRGVVTPDDTGPTPRVADLDRDELTPPTQETPLTELGSIVGTPAYMSPEQYRSATVDERSDQFSFCVTLYEALFGKRPFKGRGKTRADNIMIGAIDEPDPKASVPSWVVAIVMRGLATAPEQRFPSMTALVDALARDPRRRRRRIAIGVAGVTLFATAATLVGWRLHANDSSPCAGAEVHFAGVWDGQTRAALERSFAATAVPYADASAKRTAAMLDAYRGSWVAMRTDACRATRIRGEQSERVLDLRMACLDERLDQVRALTTLLTRTVDAKTVEEAVNATTALPPLATCADAAVLLQPGAEPQNPAARTRRRDLLRKLDQLNVERRLGRVDGALATARALLRDARATNDERLIAHTLALAGVLAMDEGELAEAEQLTGEAIRRARKLGDADLLVSTMIDLVSTLAEGGISKAREALGVIRLVKALVDDARDPALALRLAVEEANEHMVLARHEVAVPILEQALERGKQVLGDDHALVFRIAGLYGSALARIGKHDQAIVDYDALIATQTRVLGPLHPSTLNARLQRCRVFGLSGDHARAVSCFADVLPDAERIEGRSDREILSFRSLHAQSLVSLGKLEDARRLFTETLADVPAGAWNDHWFVAADIARTLGEIEIMLGDYQSALAHCERAVASVDAAYVGTLGPTCVGEALLGLGQVERALAVLEPLRAQFEHVDPTHSKSDPRQAGAWRFAYAQALWAARRDATRARALATKARDELGTDPSRARLDAWLAKLPAR